MPPRLTYPLLIFLTILLGLSIRKFSSQLPHFIAEHFGDALWAAMVYFGFRFLLPHKSKVLVAGCAVAFSFAIEFSQLYQAEWITNIRSTTLGALILGSGFLWIDLPRYAAGVLAAFVVDYYLLRKPKSRPWQTKKTIY